jgi:hypothetical protein
MLLRGLVVRGVPILLGLAGMRELFAPARRAFASPLAPPLEGVALRVQGIGCGVQNAVFRV